MIVKMCWSNVNGHIVQHKTQCNQFYVGNKCIYEISNPNDW